VLPVSSLAATPVLSGQDQANREARIQVQCGFYIFQVLAVTVLRGESARCPKPDKLFYPHSVLHKDTKNERMIKCFLSLQHFQANYRYRD
jgi:hypothetical protein